MEAKAKAADLVGELFKLMPAASGIMLALIWGLANGNTPPDCVMTTIRIASVILFVSIFLSLLGLQFMVTQLQRQNDDVSKHGSVQFCFLFAWLSFIAGSVVVIVSLYLI